MFRPAAVVVVFTFCFFSLLFSLAWSFSPVVVENNVIGRTTTTTTTTTRLSLASSGGGNNKNNNNQRPLSLSERERREEDKRRQQRARDVVIGKTSAKAGETDYELNIAATEQEWLKQATSVEQQVFRQTELGMTCLKRLQLERADAAFDRVLELRPTAYLWQAGIVRYYLDRLYDAANVLAQSAVRFESRFGEPASEERIWRSASELRLWTSCTNKKERQRLRELQQQQRQQQQNANDDDDDDSVVKPFSLVAQIPPKDNTAELLASERRKVLKTARELFDAALQQDNGGIILSRARLQSICGTDTTTMPQQSPSQQSAFVAPDRKLWKLSAWFYLGLYYDAVGDDEQAKQCLKMALRLSSSGAGKAQDILHTLPLLHMSQRQWFDDEDWEEDSESAEESSSASSPGNWMASQRPNATTTTTTATDNDDDKNKKDNAKKANSSSSSTSAILAAHKADPVLFDSLQQGIEELVVVELREALRIRGLGVSGTKQELRDRLFCSLLRDAGYRV